jgi:photosynthesis system II assembly factor YCF48-like protein
LSYGPKKSRLGKPSPAQKHDPMRFFLFLLLILLAGCTSTSKVQTIELDRKAEPTDIFFLDENHGWLTAYDYEATSNVVFRTVDGGASWETSEIPGKGGVRGVYFTDADNGAVLGTGGTAFTSSDGGKSWKKVESSISVDSINCGYGMGILKAKRRKAGAGMYLYAFPLDEGIQAGFSVGRTDKGKSVDGFQFQVVAPKTLIVTANKEIFQSRDGGRSWTTLASLDPKNVRLTYSSAFFLDKDRGWLASSGGGLSYTEDGGRTTQNLEPQGVNGNNLHNLRFFDQKHGIAMLNRKLLVATKDGGKTWEQVVEIPRKQVDQLVLFALDPSHVWTAHGNRGTKVTLEKISPF